MSRQPGSILDDRVRLDALVSEGPWATVWRGTMVGSHVDVAVKIARGEVGARMLREEASVAERLGRLHRESARLVRQHDGYVTPPASGEDPGLAELLHHEDPGEDAPPDQPAYLITRWIGDTTLRDWMGDWQTEDARSKVTRKLLAVVKTIGRVHAAGIAHGDLKPENVLVDEEGAPRVVDFGLAREIRELRLAGSLRSSLSTRDALTGGTLAYLPPEAVKGAEPSPRGDVYALGVMLHEVLLGERPRKACPPDALRRRVHPEVARILLRALAFDPNGRYRDAAEMHEAMEKVGIALFPVALTRAVLAIDRGLAAFLVALRYSAVAAFVALYALIPIAIAAGIVLAIVHGDPMVAVGSVLGAAVAAALAAALHAFVGTPADWVARVRD